ncbi:hypothetical protein EON65_29770 [archaeon]|nr:MAG: hypothetical protein EON65_29770 [archaeon]
MGESYGDKCGCNLSFLQNVGCLEYKGRCHYSALSLCQRAALINLLPGSFFRLDVSAEPYLMACVSCKLIQVLDLTTDRGFRVDDSSLMPALPKLDSSIPLIGCGGSQ